MERHFDACLDSLKHLLLSMSALAEQMIADAVKALVERDAAVLPRVYEHEERVNQLQKDVDEMCFTLIALHQPAAADLRFILAASKINTDLERLADQAVNICHKAERLITQPPVKDFAIIPEMAVIARGMVKDSLHAYVNRDVDTARDVIMRDRRLNEGKVAVTENLAQVMMANPAAIPRALDIVLVSHNLERIGDHAKNIAENVIFVVQGKDVRHYAPPAAGDKAAGA